MNAGNLDIRLTADTATLVRAMDVAQSAVATVGTSRTRSIWTSGSPPPTR
jgi:hypothetical protein